MNLINVLNSELRDEALLRWKITKEVAKGVNGVIYGSMAAIVVEGLPRLPRDADIAVEWGLDKFLEWFREFEKEGWFEVEFVRQPPSLWKNGGPRYTLLLWEKDYEFFVNIASERVKPNKEVEGVKLRFDKNEYVEQKKRKVLEGNPTILDILDLFWFEGERAWEFVSLLPEDVRKKIVRSMGKFMRLVPRETRAVVEEIHQRLNLL